MGKIARRSVDCYMHGDGRALNTLLEKVEESTARANRALDEGLATIAAGMARIEHLERQVARRRATKQGKGR